MFRKWEFLFKFKDYVRIVFWNVLLYIKIFRCVVYDYVYVFVYFIKIYLVLKFEGNKWFY